MRPNKNLTTGAVGLALLLSVTACTSSEPVAEPVPSSTSASVGPTSSATPPTASSSPGSPPTPSSATGQAPQPTAAPETSPATGAPSAAAPAPAAPQPTSPEQPPGTPAETATIDTPEQALELIRADYGQNTDLEYSAAPDPLGEEGFEVVVRSISLRAGGGSGTVEVWQVYPNGTYSRDN